MRVKTQAKRESIVAAAAQVFREAGFEGASMAEIATRAGGSKATLYGYFTSKEELFVEVMQTSAHDQFGQIFDALHVDGTDLSKALQAFGEKAQGFLCSTEAIQTRRAILAQAGRSDIGQRFYENGPRKGIAQMAAFLASHMAAGRLRQADPALAATQFMSLLDCETVAPLLLGIEESLSRARIRLAVRRAVEAFLQGYGVNAALRSDA